MNGALDIELVLTYLEHYGLYFFFLLVFLEYLKFPLLPAGIVLPSAGIFLSQGNESFIGAVMVSLVAGIFGSLTAYSIGYFIGNPSIEKIASKSNALKKVMDTAYDYIDKHGNRGLLFIRFVPIARTLSSLVAGTMHVKMMSFVFYSAIGIFIWNIIYMYLGYMFGGLILQRS